MQGQVYKGRCGDGRGNGNTAGQPFGQFAGGRFKPDESEELAQRMTALESEIARSAAMLESKKGSRSDAEAFFKS